MILPTYHDNNLQHTSMIINIQTLLITLTLIAGANHAPALETNILDFDSVDAITNVVDAADYLADNGVILSGVTRGSTVFIQSDLQFYGTPGIVFASSPHNFLAQAGQNSQSFTLNFAKPLSGLSFTRITETGGPGNAGNSFGAWSAEVFAGTNLIAQVGEPGYSIFGPDQINPAQTYTFSGPGITRIVFDGNDYADGIPFYGTGSILLDDLTLVSDLHSKGRRVAKGHHRDEVPDSSDSSR
jgi:hypothetical protein